jgi:hypothetical protein
MVMMVVVMMVVVMVMVIVTKVKYIVPLRCYANVDTSKRLKITDDLRNACFLKYIKSSF